MKMSIKIPRPSVTINDSSVSEVLQWSGAFFIAVGHVLNTLGSHYHKDFWNILAFTLGTIAFFLWSLRVANKPQMAVNVVALATMAVGLIKSQI